MSQHILVMSKLISDGDGKVHENKTILFTQSGDDKVYHANNILFMTLKSL